MESAGARGSHVGLSPSIRSHCRVPTKNFSAGPSGFLCRHRQRTPLPLLRAAYTLDSHNGDEPVDVIGIGSRKDSIIDFCLASPAVSASRFRFWTIYSRDQKKVQLLERCHSKDVLIRNVEFPRAPHSCLPATILVASAGHDLDQIAAVDLLCCIKSVGGLAIAIVLKPFSFEGQRRQKEVNDLVNKLKLCSNFYVVVEADSFFKAEIGTLAEALESANNTVLLAMWTISSMISNTHANILCTSEGKVKDVNPSEVIKVFEGYGELKIYHGAGYSVNAAIMQAIFQCPSSADLKGFNRLAIMLLTSACNIGENDMLEINSSFRGITGYTGDIIFSKMCEPNLEPKFVATTLLIMGGHNEKMVSHNKGFLGSILENLPFFYRFFKINSTEASNLPANNSSGDPLLASASGSKSVWDFSKLVYPLEHILNLGEFPDKLENVTLRNCSDSCHETIGEVAELEEINNLPVSKFGSQSNGGKQGIAVKQGSHEIGPAFHIAQLWAKKCSASRSNKNDNVDTFSLPVGVKSSTLYPDSNPYSNHGLAENSDYINNEVLGITSDISKKDSLLSARAAMMLEAERESLKSWNPVVEIQYRGGMYRGRCRAGLPDGKGRLTSMDGSFYEGFWKCGKRSGLGTFCYSNGDLFRGPWRDDLMHGKGWFYFHTGDRWFANFWRGKANGEGRFFSKNGSVFFGFFRDGWRHGQSVCIDADGSRWTELWDDGILVNRTPLDK